MSEPVSKLCYEWANDVGKQSRVEYFMVRKALQVYGEGPGSGHAERLAYAEKIIDGTTGPRVYSMGVTTVNGVKTAISNGEEPTDQQLQQAVNNVFNKFSKIDE